MVQQHYQAYKNNSVNTASPAELTLMLYNGCLKFIKHAKKGIENKDIQMKNTNIQKAQNIISELMVTLDQDAPIAKDMMPLYDYINRRLIDANVKNDLTILMEAYGLVEQFRDTWKEVVKKTRMQEYSESARA
ncbi:flagellar protein FliS [Pelagirhabdus alkalitolerans]|uniref:Flagellar secretion chaperone FliS n=1 Tax=Pelagirhabdus alkalitolerans TaxID=1612202 RepID=A0A1G6MRZ5_9BACI|nr:flagellar export chaperone FliS [Pelagirhabdus alkalitolerans]SDC58320.1 flagellar protein FliS [Pelagirhabdus alkalitolerans]